MKHIVFDLGGVLVDWNPRYLYKKIFSNRPDEMELFLTQVCNKEWNDSLDAGRSFAEAVAEKQKKFPQFESEIQAYWKRWDEMLGGEIPGTVKLLTELRKSGVGLWALTNWSAETFPIAQRQFEFLSWFEDVCVSGVEKLRKPDARFFQILLRRNQLVPHDCLFIDDVEANIVAAQALGMQTHHFVSPEILGTDLQRRGLVAGE